MGNVERRGPHHTALPPPRRRRMNAGSTKRRHPGTGPTSRAVARQATVGVVLLLSLVGAAVTVVLVRREASVRREWSNRLVGTVEERKAAIRD